MLISEEYYLHWYEASWDWYEASWDWYEASWESPKLRELMLKVDNIIPLWRINSAYI